MFQIDSGSVEDVRGEQAETQTAQDLPVVSTPKLPIKDDPIFDPRSPSVHICRTPIDVSEATPAAESGPSGEYDNPVASTPTAGMKKEFIKCSSCIIFNLTDTT